MSNYVYSTLTNDNAYAVYAPSNSKEIASISKKILIHGGHGVATKQLVTPQGVMTQVSDEDLELLLKDYHFKKHMELGFIKVEKRREAPEKVAEDMAEKDKSAPLTEADYEQGTDTGSDKGSKSYRAKKGKL